MEINFEDLILPGKAPVKRRERDEPESSLSSFESVEDTEEEEEEEEQDDSEDFHSSQLESSPIKTTTSVGQERYEQLRRSAFSKNTLKKVIQKLTLAGVGPVMLFVIGGFTKIYVGEITAIALGIMKDRQIDGPIPPEVLAEAYRLYHNRNFRNQICTFFPRNSLNKRLLCKRL